MLHVQFWGTRGSIAKAGLGTVRYGGNTSCVEVQSRSGTLILLDCGTGAHALGHALVARGSPLRGHILITHTHWDHIQGIPFFAPLFVAGNEWDIYAPRGVGQSIRDTLAGQMQYTYFPITLEQFGATITYHDLVEGAFDVGSVRVTTRYLNHPALTLAYRLEGDGVTVVYATDHEPYSRHLAAGATPTDIRGEDRRHADFLADADLVIHDAQYTASEYSAKVGWGHSTVEYVVDVARAVGVRRLALFHHDPMRDDESVDRLVEAARNRAGSSIEVFAAAEGQVLELRGDSRAAAVSGPETSAVAELPPAMFQHSVLVAVRDPATAVVLSDAVRADGFRLFIATDGDTALTTARSERPSLLVLERDLPERGGLDLCRAIRADGSFYGRDVPVVLVTEREDPSDLLAGGDAGVTDWLVKPFSSVYARTRIRCWLLRTACGWKRAPLPDDESDRLMVLRQLAVLDTDPEDRFDRITRLAATIFNVPIALVSLVDADRQWFKSSHGLSVRETPRDMAFCSHAILGEAVLMVPDALLDPRFADNPLVTHEPRVRFYAGYPLSIDARRVGTLCLIDHRPRQLDEAGLRLLRDLGDLVCQELNATRPT